MREGAKMNNIPDYIKKGSRNRNKLRGAIVPARVNSPHSGVFTVSVDSLDHSQNPVAPCYPFSGKKPVNQGPWETLASERMSRWVSGGWIDGINKIHRSPFEETGNVLFPDVFFIGVIDKKMGIKIAIFLKKHEGFFREQ
jgi:hypothetical protein